MCLFRLIFVLQVLVLNTSVDNSMRKTLHGFAGIYQNFSAEKNTLFTYQEAEDEEDEDKDAGIDTTSKQYAKKIKNNTLPIFVLFDPDSKLPLAEERIKICKSNMGKFNICYGGIGSIYLAEFLDICSFGICILQHNTTHETFTLDSKGHIVGEQSEKNINNNDDDDNDNSDDDDDLNRSIYLNRRLTMIGLFFQVQNDDLDEYMIALKLNALIGAMHANIITKDPRLISHDELQTVYTQPTKYTLATAIVAQLLFRMFDLEGSIMIGIQWAPMGMNFESKHVAYEKNKAITTQSKLKTSHLPIFIAFSLGVAWN